MSPNRVVAVLTPIVFVPLAGYIATLVAKHVPGVQIDQGQITAVFVAGALSVLPPMWKWLDGWQKYEQREQDARLAASLKDDASTWDADSDDDAADDDEPEFAPDDVFVSAHPER
jgi:hypothetical protein